jgi:soluble lytic murein transglycosylase-like protein
MIRTLCLASMIAAFISITAVSAQEGTQERRMASTEDQSNLDSLIARHAAANNLPEAMVRRIIKRESGGNPRVISKGNYGLMQIRLGTARAMGYGGSAAGLLDPDTNMTYAVKYLAGAYNTAGGNADRTVHYYAAGYYYAAKSKGRPDRSGDQAFASAADQNPATLSPPVQGPSAHNFK